MEKYKNRQSAQSRHSPLVQGTIDGIPIAMGYFAVAFSLGIIASRAGLTALSGFVASWFTRASAGEYGVYSLVAMNATYIEIIGMALVANLRYMLMSTALTQKFREGTSLLKRILAAYCMTDEVFGISVAWPGHLPVAYPVGATLISATAWAAGSAFGIMAAGASFIPRQVSMALGVALYGMFIAIIVPPAKRDKAVLAAVACSLAMSGICSVLPYISEVSAGTRTILLTVVISTIAAIVKPISEETDGKS